MKKIFLNIIFCVFSFNLQAKSLYSPTLNFSLGVYNMTVDESESTLQATDSTVIVPDEEIFTGLDVSAISLEVSYESFLSSRNSLLVSGGIPFSSEDGVGKYYLSVGTNYYINPVGSVLSFSDLRSQIVTIPTFKYYIGANLSVGYLIYNTVSAKKSDVVLDVGFSAGAVYNISKDWGIGGEVKILRGIGVATSSTTFSGMVGVTYNFNS